MTMMVVAFFIYTATLLAIGLWASRTQKTSSDADALISGNESINWWVTAISAHAADMSSWLFMGLPAAVYLNGITDIWVAVGLIVGMFMSWQFLAPALRRATHQYRATTLTSYFEERYHARGRLSIVSACIMAFFFIIYLAAGIKGVGDLLGSTFSIPPVVGGVLTLLVVVAYTFIGGFVAAAWVDFFQGIFLLISILATSILGYYVVGGFSAIANAAAAKGVPMSISWDLSNMTTILLGPIAWGLGYFGMPHILSKFIAAQDPEQMHKSKYIGLTWQFLALGGALLAGFVGIAYFVSPLIDPELLFIRMTISLFPPLIAGFILCGILSATLSTMNAQMLVLAGVICDDLYKKLYRPNASQREIITVFRVSIICVCLVACAIAWSGKSSIFSLVQFAWGGLGASFGPLTLLSLYYPGINRYGAFWGIVAGCIGSILWKVSGVTLYGYTVNEVLPGFALGVIVIVGVSWLTKESK